MSSTAQQNDGPRQIKCNLHVELLAEDKLGKDVFSFPFCRLENKNYKENLVLARSHQAEGLIVGRGCASGKVPSLSPPDVAQSRVRHALPGLQTAPPATCPLRGCGAPGDAPLLQAHHACADEHSGASGGPGNPDLQRGWDRLG